MAGTARNTGGTGTKTAAEVRGDNPPETNGTNTDWDSLLDSALVETRSKKVTVDVPPRVQALVDGAYLNNSAVTLPVKDETAFDELKNVLSCAADASEHKISIYAKKVHDNKQKLTHLRFTVGNRRGNNPKGENSDKSE